MPIEIRELVIKATVSEEGGAGKSNAAAGGNNGAQPGEETIKDCLDKIMDAIKDKNER